MGSVTSVNKKEEKGGGLTAKLVLGAANKKRANPRDPELLGSWHQVEARTD